MNSFNRVDAVNNCAIWLQRVLNNPQDENAFQSALSALRSGSLSSELIELVRADKLVFSPDVGFIPTGVKWLDDSLGGGIRKGELFFVAGETHSGKTHILVYLAAKFIKQKLTVAHFNGEDNRHDVYEIYGKILDDSDRDWLYVGDVRDCRFDINSIEQAIEGAKAKGVDPDIVLIDNLDVMAIGKHAPDWQAVGDLVRDLKMFARQYNCIVLTASQSGIQDDQMPAKFKKSGLARLYRGKASKAMHADIIFTIEEKTDNYMHFKVPKRRGKRIEKRDVYLNIDFDTMLLHDIG